MLRVQKTGMEDNIWFDKFTIFQVSGSEEENPEENLEKHE